MKEVLNADIPLSHHTKSSSERGEEGHHRAEPKASALVKKARKLLKSYDLITTTTPGGNMHCCPVCKVRTNPNKAYVKVQYKHVIYYLCCPLCQSTFEKEPEKYVKNITELKK